DLARLRQGARARQQVDLVADRPIEADDGSAEHRPQAGQPAADDLGCPPAEVERQGLAPGDEIRAKLPPPGRDRLVHQEASPTTARRGLGGGTIPNIAASRRRGATRSASVVRSSTARNAASAACKACCSTQ